MNGITAMTFEILKILDRLDAADSSEILDALGKTVSGNSLNEALESLERKGLVVLHAQSRSGREAKYDLIVLTKEGRQFAEYVGKIPSPKST